MADINTIKLPNNVQYPLVDKNARIIMRENGATNYLPINGTSGSDDGIAWIFNADGSVTIDGTATNDVYIPIITCGSSTGDVSLSDFDLLKYNDENHSFVIGGDTSVVAELEASYELTDGETNIWGYLMIRSVVPVTTKRETVNIDMSSYPEFVPIGESLSLIVPSGTVLSDERIYFMVVMNEDSDNAFAPYALTNKQITDKLKNGTGGASSMAQLADVDLTGLTNNDVLVYMAELGKWVVESGHVVTIALSQEAHDALTPTQQIDPHYFYVITDATDVDVDINDNSVAPDKVWSSEKVNNLVKVNTFEVSTIGWVEDVISQSGVSLYKKQVSLNHVYVESPSIDIGSASGSVLPTTAQQEAYDLVQYCTVDTTVPCLYLYASDIPTDGFYINVGGVD
jgi:hypothetical protein